MSQEEHRVPASVQRLIAQHSGFREGFPHLYGFLVTRASDFRGLSLYLADSGAYLAVLKRFGDDGRPEIMFCSAGEVFECLSLADKALQGGKWKEDNRV